MSCYKPLKAFLTTTGVVFHEASRNGDFIGDIKLPCGRCVGCRMDRAEDWTLRVMHEAQMWPRNCFVTLTYDEAYLPPNAELVHRDFQLFMKRVRKAYGPSIRFFMCGEYGPLNLRPHFHACLFNVDFDPNTWKVAGKSASGAVYFTCERLSSLWPLGFATVQHLVRETAGYCARYIMKKALGQDAETRYTRVCPKTGELFFVQPEYAAMSLKPGIGAMWYKKYGRTDVHRHDHVVGDGVRKRVPKYYDKLLKRVDKARLEDIKLARVERALQHCEDNTPERLRAKEIVHEARISTLTRGLDK